MNWGIAMLIGVGIGLGIWWMRHEYVKLTRLCERERQIESIYQRWS